MLKLTSGGVVGVGVGLVVVVSVLVEVFFGGGVAHNYGRAKSGESVAHVHMHR